VDAPWLPRAAATVGMAARASGGPACIVIAFDSATGALHLDGPLLVSPRTVIELSADEEAPILAARPATGAAVGGPLPPISMRLGTTRGTNALLERRAGPVALFITHGFGDLLEIGDQQRPDIFALDIRKPLPLHSAVVEVPGRLDAAGREIAPLDLDRAEA